MPAMAKSIGIAGRFFQANMFFFLLAVAMGIAFILTSASANFFEWRITDCIVKGQQVGTAQIFAYTLDMYADIGWRDFTISHLNAAANDNGCFGDLVEGREYPLGDYQVGEL